MSDGQWKELNDEALAAHIGVSGEFVRRVRNEFATVGNSSEPIRRKGKDGKSYPATKKRKPAPKPEPVEEPEDERKAGEMLAAMDKRKNQYAGCTPQPALTDLGIEKTQSHRWRRNAAKCGATTTFAGVGNGNGDVTIFDPREP